MGLKEPGRNRGVYLGQVLMSRTNWLTRIQLLGEQDQIEFIEADSLLPSVKVRIRSLNALARVRRLSFVDFVEPIIVRRPSMQGTSVGPFYSSSYSSSEDSFDDSSSGCTPHVWGGSSLFTAEGDTYSEQEAALRVQLAWMRANGSGVDVGHVDTGLHPNAVEFTQSFNSGLSTGRWLKIRRHDTGRVNQPPRDACGHGTRTAGVVAAPRNGLSSVGIAWNANFASVLAEDDPWVNSSDNLQKAIREAANAVTDEPGRDVILLSVAGGDWWWQVSNEIDYWHVNSDILFIGAAGTSFSWINSQVLFPADHANVVAVGCSEYPSGPLPVNCHYGEEVQFQAYQRLPTIGYSGSATLVNRISGTSSTSAFVAGVAALVRHRYPTWNRAQVLDRMRRAGHLYPNRDSNAGYGRLDAYAAVGGMRVASITGPASLRIDVPTTFSASGDGDGPYSVLWSTSQQGAVVDVTLSGSTGSRQITAAVTDQVDGFVLNAVKTVQVGASPYVYIDGPDAITTKNTYRFSAIYSGFWSGFALTWEEMYCTGTDAGCNVWQVVGSGNFVDRFLQPSCGAGYGSRFLRVTATDSHRAQRTSTHEIDMCASDNPPPPIPAPDEGR